VSAPQALAKHSPAIDGFHPKLPVSVTGSARTEYGEFREKRRGLLHLSSTLWDFAFLIRQVGKKAEAT
jgi:hypothetical protein